MKRSKPTHTYKKPRRETRSFIHSPFVLAAALLIAVLVMSSVVSQYKNERAFRVRVDEKMRTLENLRAAHAALAERVIYAESPQGREAYVRESYDLALPGETLVVLSPQGNAIEDATSSAGDVPEPTVWNRVKSWFR